MKAKTSPPFKFRTSRTGLMGSASRPHKSKKQYCRRAFKQDRSKYFL